MNPSNVASGLFSIVQGISSNPYVVGAAALIVGVLFFFLWRWLKPWLQKVQDVKNEQAVTQVSQQVEHDTQDVQHQANDLFNK